ncbi:MAG: thermonuclease family protein [Mycobacteriales bacterium]
MSAAFAQIAAVRLLLALLTGLLVGCATPAAENNQRSPVPTFDPGSIESPAVPRDAFPATVVRVVDGDTVIAAVAGSTRPVRVRLIGIDTPETVRPNTLVACYGEQAATLSRRLLTGARVRAAYEPGGRQDRFGRELWDVWLSDGRFVQAVLVTAGAARAYPYRPQVRYAGLIARLADAARVGRRGLWGPPCDGHSFGEPHRSRTSVGRQLD